jgi:hypothetical protein
MNSSYQSGTASPCPNCGSFHTQQTSAHETAMVIGGLAGAAIITGRLIARASPLFASTLIVGGLIGTVWGTSIGSMIGESIDQMLLRRHKCLACGENFST